MKPFDAPKKSLTKLDADTSGRLVVAAADVALIVDSKGVVRDVAVGSEDFARAQFDDWIGQRWVDTVSEDSRPKIAILLQEAVDPGDIRRRHINHPTPDGPDLPILYAAVSLGPRRRTVALGRDLRPVAALQQRLVEAQQSIERDYSRVRQVEMRYRLLFRTTSDAVLIVDAATGRVLEANPAAAVMFGRDVADLVGLAFPEGFDLANGTAVSALLSAVRAGSRETDLRTELAADRREINLSASLFRQNNAPQFLVRLSPAETAERRELAPTLESKLLQVVREAPDGLVLTDRRGQVLSANAAFLDLAELATEDQAHGLSLDRWLGRSGVDFNVLVSNLKETGSLRLFPTTLRGEHGSTADVEISAVAVTNGEAPCFGFSIRNVSPRVRSESGGEGALPRSIEQLTELVGRVPLKELVRQTTDVIERLFIEAALEMTGDNRASAAEMLGLSRQSLYVKLRRYGLGNVNWESKK